jgi:uncharacterized membrane protein
MQICLENFKKIGRKISLNDDKGYAVAIFLVLIIVSALTVGYFVVSGSQPSGYSTIYLLDSQGKAVNYPDVLVANQNSTFIVPVAVENHMGGAVHYSVLVKITDKPSSFPVDVLPSETYNMTLGNGQSWQNSATVTENQVGSYSVVFELWQYNPDSGTYQFKNNNVENYCVLNIQVVN